MFKGDGDLEWKRPLNWTGNDPSYYQSFDHEDSSFRLMNGAQIVTGRVKAEFSSFNTTGIDKSSSVRQCFWRTSTHVLFCGTNGLVFRLSVLWQDGSLLHIYNVAEVRATASTT